jgi:NADPH-dependent 2,4-dienoyl-CoA reductase/sulfur reductase-like enzyme
MHVVVVGSGLAGVTAAESLARDGSRQVTLVSFAALAPVRVMAGTRAERIDRGNRCLVLPDRKLAQPMVKIHGFRRPDAERRQAVAVRF